MAQELIMDTGRFGRNPRTRFSGIRDSKISIWVEDANNPANIMMGQADNTNVGPTLNSFKCRGTVEAPLDVAEHDHVTGKVGYAFSGGTFFDVGTIFYKIDGAYVSGQRPPARYEVFTGPANTVPTQRFVVKSSGFVGIGQFDANAGINPDSILHVARNDDTRMKIQLSVASSAAPSLHGKKSRGTIAAPASVVDGDELLYIQGEAFTNAWHENTGAIVIQVDGAVVAGQRPANRIVLRTGISGAGGPTDRMKVLSAGTIFMGDVSGTPDTNRKVHILRNTGGFAPFKVEHSAGGASANPMIVKGGDNVTTGSLLITFQRPDDTVIGSISQNAATTVAYNTSSDARLKENIVDMPGGLVLVKSMRPRIYNFKGDSKNTLHGFIAQELHEVFPQAVTPGKGSACECHIGEEDASGDICTEHKEECCHISPWGVDYGKLTPVLAKAIQELDARLTALGG